MHYRKLLAGFPIPFQTCMMQPWAYFNLVAFHVGSSQFQLGVLKVRSSFEKTLFILPKNLKQDIFILPKKKKQFETRNINLSRTNFLIFFFPQTLYLWWYGVDSVGFVCAACMCGSSNRKVSISRGYRCQMGRAGTSQVRSWPGTAQFQWAQGTGTEVDSTAQNLVWHGMARAQARKVDGNGTVLAGHGHDTDTKGHGTRHRKTKKKIIK